MSKKIGLISIFFLSSRLMFLLFAFLATFWIPQRAGYLGSLSFDWAPDLVWVWANFDGMHYLDIASSGYDRYNFAFFPLYPALIALINNITYIPHLYIGILISLISFFLACLMIFKITKLDFNKDIALLTIIFLAFFPLSFYYHSVYTDSLFLLLTTASFYFARRNNWLLAGIFGGLSSIDRLSGLSLIPALAVEWYWQNKEVIKQKSFSILSLYKSIIPALFLTFLGFLTYISYLQIKFGDWLLFQKSMISWRQDEFVFPLQTLYRYLKIFFSVHPALFEYWIAVLEFVSFLIYIVLSFYVLKKIRPSYGIFMMVLLLLVTFTGTLAGGPRYTLHLFPGFIGLAHLAIQNKPLKIIFILLFSILGLSLTALFTRGYFIS